MRASPSRSCWWAAWAWAPSSPRRRRARASPGAARPLASHAAVERWRALDLPLRHPPVAGTARYEFIGGSPAIELFPHADWRRCTLHALRESARTRALYGPAEGQPELRAAIARHVGFARGVRCTAQDVVVTSGAQQALALLARVLVEPRRHGRGRGSRLPAGAR